jgi:hypothetical protein
MPAANVDTRRAGGNSYGRWAGDSGADSRVDYEPLRADVGSEGSPKQEQIGEGGGQVLRGRAWSCVEVRGGAWWCVEVRGGARRGREGACGGGRGQRSIGTIRGSTLLTACPAVTCAPSTRPCVSPRRESHSWSSWGAEPRARRWPSSSRAGRSPPCPRARRAGSPGDRRRRRGRGRRTAVCARHEWGYIGRALGL